MVILFSYCQTVEETSSYNKYTNALGLLHCLTDKITFTTELTPTVFLPSYIGEFHKGK